MFTPSQRQDTPRATGRAMSSYRTRATGRSLVLNHSRAVPAAPRG